MHHHQHELAEVMILMRKDWIKADIRYLSGLDLFASMKLHAVAYRLAHEAHHAGHVGGYQRVQRQSMPYGMPSFWLEMQAVHALDAGCMYKYMCPPVWWQDARQSPLDPSAEV